MNIYWSQVLGARCWHAPKPSPQISHISKMSIVAFQAFHSWRPCSFLTRRRNPLWKLKRGSPVPLQSMNRYLLTTDWYVELKQVWDALKQCKWNMVLVSMGKTRRFANQVRASPDETYLTCKRSVSCWGGYFDAHGAGRKFAHDWTQRSCRHILEGPAAFQFAQPGKDPYVPNLCFQNRYSACTHKVAQSTGTA